MKQLLLTDIVFDLPTQAFGSGYSVVLENTASNIAVTIAQPPLTGLLMVEALAGLVTLAATFTSSHDKHIYIMVLAIILTLASFIIDAVLFTSVEKIVPIFGSQVQSSLGAGSSMHFPPNHFPLSF